MAKLGELRAKLNEQQALFCELYVINFEPAEAAIKAGYSETSAASIASQLRNMTKIRNYIAGLMEQKRKELAPTMERLKLEVLDIAFSDVTELYKHLANGRGMISDIHLETLNKLPRKVKACISEIYPTKFGYRVKFYNKIAALEMLAKHLGFYEVDNLQKTNTGVGIYLPDNGRPMPEEGVE